MKNKLETGKMILSNGIYTSIYDKTLFATTVKLKNNNISMFEPYSAFKQMCIY